MTSARRTVGIALVACFLAGMGALAGLACSSQPTIDDNYVPLAKQPRHPDDGGGDLVDETPPPDSDGGTDEDAAVPDDDAGPAPDADAGACVGKADGTSWKDNDALARCCGGQPVRVNTKTNCGTCGVTCPNGGSCRNGISGHLGCGCPGGTDKECVTAGYGTGATCYLGDCNCQCASGNSCKGLCKGGGTCFMVTDTNYCSYP